MYRSYLSATLRLNDHVGQALAYNSIGNLNLLNLNLKPFLAIAEFNFAKFSRRRFGKSSTLPLPPDFLYMHLLSSVEAHRCHLAIADERGQFLALTNLGLALDQLGDVPVILLNTLISHT